MHGAGRKRRRETTRTDRRGEDTVLGRQEESVAGNRATGAGVQDGVEVVGLEVVGLDGFVTGDAGGETGSAELYRPLKIAAIYARLSTERQEKEQTVDSQLDALYRAAREGGLRCRPPTSS